MSKTIATQRRFLSDIVVCDAKGNEVNKDEQKIVSGVANERHKFRNIVIKNKTLRGCTGSAEVEMGRTRVTCAVSGPREEQSGDSALEGILNISMHGSSVDPSMRYTLQHALHSVICLKKLARTELSIEINVLADDGGVLAACLLAAGVAISSANIEMIDILLACQILIPTQQFSKTAKSNEQNAAIILDPDQATLLSYAGNGATLTIGIIPSIGQIVCTEFGGTPLPLDAIRHVLPMAFDYCIELYQLVRQVVLSKVNNHEEADD